jgi:ribose/xylose/arabinose/galactoside ABC-type transport system permease subunit
MSFALGATVGATAMVFILASNWLGFGPGLLVGLLFGSLLTGLQGLLIGWVRANPIIVSIAALALIYGVAQAFAEKGRSTPRPAPSPRRSRARSQVSRSSSSYSYSPP